MIHNELMIYVGYFLCYTQIWSIVLWPHMTHLCKLWRAIWRCTTLLDAFQQAGPSPSKQNTIVPHRNGALNVCSLCPELLSLTARTSWNRLVSGFVAHFSDHPLTSLLSLRHTFLGCLLLFLLNPDSYSFLGFAPINYLE